MLTRIKVDAAAEEVLAGQGHGLDSVRRHYDERLAQWARYEDLTNTTKTKTKTKV